MKLQCELQFRRCAGDFYWHSLYQISSLPLFLHATLGIQVSPRDKVDTYLARRKAATRWRAHISCAGTPRCTATLSVLMSPVYRIHLERLGVLLPMADGDTMLLVRVFQWCAWLYISCGLGTRWYVCFFAPREAPLKGSQQRGLVGGTHSCVPSAVLHNNFFRLRLSYFLARVSARSLTYM